MNNEKLYKSIISKAQGENRTKNSSKYELHHIVPKSLGGDNGKHNLIYLTFREHYLCHYLLSKIYNDSRELAYAFWAMNNQFKGNSKRKHKTNSRLFAYAKKRVKKLMIGNTHNLGNKHSDKTKQLMSEQATGVHHHLFKGFYITPWGKFESSIAAKNEYISNVSINKWCKGAKTLILSKNRYLQNVDIFPDITLKDIGKTLYELGFDYETAERVIPSKKVKEILPENHSMFKGYYITPWGKYTSNLQCKRDVGLDLRTWCKNPDIKLRKATTTLYPNLFKTEDIGKTAKELGFGFESVDK